MTKEEIEEIIKSYSDLAEAMKEEKSQVIFYVGHKRNTISISDEIKTIFRIIEDVYAHEENDSVKKIMEGMKKGSADSRIMFEVPYEKNAYYALKKRIIDKVYHCYACRDSVCYEEILRERIS